MGKEIITRGTPKDRDDIIDFGNYVFSQSSGPIDFIKFVPRLYGNGQSTEKYHYLIKEDGKIKAMLCALPLTIDVAGRKLLMSYIGTVSVHPYSRGKGYMIMLMEKMLKDAKENGFVFSALGGLRQRYGYFGYEKGGIKIKFTITQTDIRHCLKDVTSELTFREIKKEDQALLDMALKLHEQQQIKLVREKDELIYILHSWNSVPYAVFEGGSAKGYFVLRGKDILEIHLLEEKLLPLVLKSLFTARNPDFINLYTADYDSVRISYLFSLFENYEILMGENLRIFDYPAFLEAFLNVKAKETLLDGDYRLAIEEKLIHVTVAGGKVMVTKEEFNAENADVILSGREAVSFFTAPLSIKRREAENSHPFLRSWFPLPLFISEIDAC